MPNQKEILYNLSWIELIKRFLRKQCCWFFCPLFLQGQVLSGSRKKFKLVAHSILQYSARSDPPKENIFQSPTSRLNDHSTQCYSGINGVKLDGNCFESCESCFHGNNPAANKKTTPVKGWNSSRKVSGSHEFAPWTSEKINPNRLVSVSSLVMSRFSACCKGCFKWLWQTSNRGVSDSTSLVINGSQSRWLEESCLRATFLMFPDGFCWGVVN